MSKELCMMIGLQASGKSTEAKDMLKSFYRGDAVIVNRDQLRIMLHDGKWSKGNEKVTMAVRDAIIREALGNGKSVIVDDTNLNPKVQDHLKQLAKQCGADFKFVDMTHVPLEECIARDKKRPNYVGEDVIRDTYNKYLRKPIPAAPIVKGLPWCVLVDLDGTVFKMKDRGPFEWSKVGQDDPRLHVMDAALGVALHGDDQIIFFSGRDACCREESELAIQKKLGVYDYLLYMRPEEDQRKDSIIKHELYEKHILGKYNVRGVFDDRLQVCRETWKELGLGDRLFRVGMVDEDDF